jgi:hypothetical protein
MKVLAIGKERKSRKERKRRKRRLLCIKAIYLPFSLPARF